MNPKNAAGEIDQLFYVNSISLRSIAEAFARHLHRALQGEFSSLSALPSYLPPPSGQETGRYLAVDFGGSRIRVSAIALHGSGRCSILKEVRRLLKDPEQGYDLTRETTEGEQVFDFIARLVRELYQEYPVRCLGLTFSYPMEQLSCHQARLLRWTKELKPRATLGRRIDLLLLAALQRNGLPEITPAAIINDTVACFLSGSYQTSGVIAGAICGTGHNSCYLHDSGLTGDPMIMNLESGNFSELPVNTYDDRLDQQSDNPGQQRLEKMTAGKYLGELFRLVCVDLMDRRLLATARPSLRTPYSVEADILSWLQSDGWEDRQKVAVWMKNHALNGNQSQHTVLLQRIGRAIVKRAITLIAASFMALLERKSGLTSPVIAVDGSVFQYMPGFVTEVENLLLRELPTVRPQLLMTPHGSSIGAAVGAALSGKQP